jgi:hypothetical protein
MSTVLVEPDAVPLVVAVDDRLEVETDEQARASLEAWRRRLLGELAAELQAAD